MKKEQGITLISLIVYVLLMTFILVGLSSITASFYSNVNDFDGDSESAVDYARFNMYFITDIKQKNAKIVSNSDKYVVISYKAEDDTTKQVEYSVQNEALYRNKVKICENVSDALFNADTVNNTIQVHTIIGDYEKDVTYKLENVNNDVEEIPTI